MLTRTLFAEGTPTLEYKGLVQPGYQPSDGDERGLWSVMEHVENEIKSSKFLVRDGEVNDYIHSITCRLADKYCPNIRNYVLRTPYFNASMAPNGMMQVSMQLEGVA